MNFKQSTIDFVNNIQRSLSEEFAKRDEICFYNQQKVIEAMQNHRLAEQHFFKATGYGYTDEGRDVTEKIFADVFKGEKAIVRGQIASGTSAIFLAVAGVVRPGDEILAITGEPYDTLRFAIGYDGYKGYPGNLSEFGVTFKYIDFKEDGTVDFDSIEKYISDKTKMIYLQRSTGYSDRPAITIDTLEKIVKIVRSIKEDVCIFCDNCYGEFLEKREPLEIGCDLIAGSLIKNAGGGLAETGGYVIGKEKYVDLVAARLTAPGLGYEVGSNLGMIRNFLQGLFIAPNVVSGAVKGSILASKVFEEKGYRVFPRYDDPRSDIVQAICLGSKEKMEAFCLGIQKASPVDSYVTPVGDAMPGYDDPVIMAAGNFISGSSIELSADGPFREPYIVYMQGGLTFDHSKLGTCSALEELEKLN